MRSRCLITPREAYEMHEGLVDGQSSVVEAAPATVKVGEARAAAVSSPGIRLQTLAVLLALLGGPLGALASAQQELLHGGGPLVAFIGAPIIEEALKPAGIYLLLLWWPRALMGRMHTAALTALSGLSFGLLESSLYIYLFYPEGGADFVLYRFTVTPLMHTTASFLVGLGLSRTLVDWAAGRAPLPRSTCNLYLAAVGLHAVYNTTAVILSVAGVLDFES
jgi:RsiW-degrading membrane proteinase PrsW (M82 family)